MATKRIIITGGPGTGKSTLLQALQEKGYYCFPEISRSIIQQQAGLNQGCFPWFNLSAFSELVFQRMVKQYQTSENLNDFCFFDRAIPDIIAYLDYAGLEIPEIYYEPMQNFLFQNYVFIAPPWPEIYTNDPERPQTFEESSALDAFLRNVYHKLGFQLINLPKTSVEERVKFTLNRINTNTFILPGD